jgi:2-polyprenyl-3-methyl-5-hydroxy-6-metoxy-1,4-benzoquinol methylase
MELRLELLRRFRRRKCAVDKTASNSEAKGALYRERVLRATDPWELVTGTEGDRLHGLDAALFAGGRSLLDLGCNNGTVARAFAENGATFVDGFDLSGMCIRHAQGAFPGSRADAHFAVCDLSLGITELRRKARRDRYDVVCYLALHQHLRKQVPLKNLVQFEDEIVAMAKDIWDCQEFRA